MTRFRSTTTDGWCSMPTCNARAPSTWRNHASSPSRPLMLATPREYWRQRQLVSSLMDRGAAPHEPSRIGVFLPLMIPTGLRLELLGGMAVLRGVTALTSVVMPSGSGPEAPMEAPSSAGRDCGVVRKAQILSLCHNYALKLVPACYLCSLLLSIPTSIESISQSEVKVWVYFVMLYTANVCTSGV